MSDVIPKVNSETVYGGDLVFDGGVRLCACADAEDVAAKFKTMLSRICPSVVFSGDGAVTVSIEKDALLPHEGYVIDINGDALTLIAANAAGWTYALVTLRQLLKPVGKSVACPCCRIEDAPRFKYRGLMLDEARNFFGEEEVKRLLDLMCLYKLNVLHWHLSDDQGYRMESEAFPLLTTVSTRRNDTQVGGVKSGKFMGTEASGYYTKSKIRAIVEYAKERNIVVVPELEMPSHCSAILAAYPKLSCTGEKKEVPTTFGTLHRSFCPGKRETYEFLDKLLDEWCELFPSKLFHIGADETAGSLWKNCPDCRKTVAENGLAGTHELLPLFVNRIADMLAAKGKLPMIWSDKLPRGVRKHVTYEAWLPLDRKAVAAEVSSGRKFVVAPYDRYYACQPYCMIPLKKTYEFEPTSITADRSDAGIFGVEMPMWTEWVYDRVKLDFNLFPRLCAFAETGWTAASRKSLHDFKRRWNAQKPLLDSFGVGYAKDKLTSPGAFARNKGTYIWKTVDQYDEVRRNKL